ncbi:MAG: tetratricopeptide (TPR) repeat protein, partial [Rhodothermales bacterium]
DNLKPVKKRKKKKKGPAPATGGDVDLGEDFAPPTAEATALLEAFPQFAQWVQTGWAGGGNGRHYRNDPKNYWPKDIDAKMAPVVAAIPKLSDLQRADLLASWRSGYYHDNTVRPLTVKAVRDYVAADPALMNSRKGVILLDKPWEQMTPEELGKLVPLLAQNADRNASLIRAFAAAGPEKDLSKAMDALLGPEAWRLPQHHDQRNGLLWPLVKACAANDTQKKEAQKRFGTLAGGLKTEDAKPDATPAARLGAFRKLWADYKSPQPKIPSVYERLVKVLKFTPEAIPDLLKDPSPEAQILARNVIAAGMSGPGSIWTDLEAAIRVNTSRYAPGLIELAKRHRGLEDMKRRYPEKCKPHPLEPALRQALANGIKTHQIQLWQLMSWINMQYQEETEEQVKLIQALRQQPAWKAMPFEANFAARQWFRKDAMTAGQIAWIDAADSAIACKNLLALPEDADVATTAAALTAAIEGVKKSPVRINILGLERLAAVGDTVFADPQVFARILEVTEALRFDCTREAEPFAARLHKHVRETRAPAVLQSTGAFLWSFGISEHYARSLIETLKLAESLLDEQANATASLAKTGLTIFAIRRQHHQGNWADKGGKAALKALYGNAAMQIGLVVIPVARNHAAYPVYKSQAEWLIANEDSAWEMLDESWGELLPVHRELSTTFLTWALQRAIYSRDELRQEELATALLDWANGPGSTWSPVQRIDLEVAYGDIAMQMGRLEAAHKIFTAAQQKEDFAAVPERHKATLRRVKVERIAKRFDDALRTLADLDLERLPEMWAPSRYARAQVHYDMAEYDDAADDITAILAREPDHAEAKIMQGKVQLKRQKLVDASELDVGSKSAQNTMVPGEKLKVTLNDPTLAVSGAGTEIEVVVSASSGDKETFFLRQFGDEKTKFRGEVRTSLGKPNPGDRVLQVIGDDKIYYAYSDRFRKKMNNLEARQGGPITVKSDAILMASARRLLTEGEQRLADMKKEMDAISRGGRETVSAATQTVLAARKAIEKAQRREVGEATDETDNAALAKAMLRARVKPGKAINVRVIDPDRSRTAEIDELLVSVESSSGDSIGRISLRETDTHSGWFEGSIPTNVAQAMAFAENSQPGRNPNMVISPNADYPAWRPVAVTGTKPAFKIDLNDNVALGEMAITAKEVGAKLKKFILQTGMNARDMTTVAVYPQDQITLEQPWHPSVTIMNDTDHHHARNDRSVYDIRELNQHLEFGWVSQRYMAGVAENVVGPSAAMQKAIPGKVTWKRQNHHHNAHVVYRFRGYFYEPATVTRRFKLQLGAFKVPGKTHPSVAHPPQFMLAVDGRPITNQEKPSRLEGHMTVRPGLHRFEIWATGWDCSIGFGRDIKLLANLDKDPEKLVDCPDSFFDPAGFPKDALPHRNGKASISANDDASVFSVAFAENSRTRLVNLVLIDQEGPVPALNKIELSAADGKQVLPVPEDFAALNKNDKLEILTGDRVAIRYVDDRFVSKQKETLERFLNVSFSDASVAFQFFEMRQKPYEQPVPYYERLLRFAHNKSLLLTINDPDMDMTDDPDTIEVVLESASGGKPFKMMEDGPSSGIFRLSITPVTGAAADDTQFQVGVGETITAIYRDAENVRPGVPVNREATIAHALYVEPKIYLSHATARPIDPSKFDKPPGARGLNVGFERRNERQVIEENAGLLRQVRRERQSGGNVRPRWQIDSEFIESGAAPGDGHAAVHGQIMHFELQAPHLALRVGSKVDVFVQTDAGRKRAGFSGQGFDIQVPGTMQLGAVLASEQNRGVRSRNWWMTPQTPIYIGGHPKHPEGITADWTQTFVCNVPLIAGFLSDEGVVSEDEIERRRKLNPYTSPHGLVAQPGERLHVGFRYLDAAGAEKWLTATARVITHPVFDIMDEDYRVERKTAYVGEALYLRVVDLGADVSDASDTVEVLMQAKSGAKHRVELQEIDSHSGVFQAWYQLGYRQEDVVSAEDFNVKRDGFPVVYGDQLRAAYTDADGQKSQLVSLTISKGADGSIAPFSKKYDDPQIAMRTQFALAEAFLEMAKRHRKLGETERAEHEYARAKDMLEKAMDMFRDPATRAQAEYLLGNLTQEEADATADPNLQEDRYRAALSRYMRVTGSYADTLPASKAQFKIATVYERLKEPEIAAQEYVKLAYKYPDSEFLALSMARLGTHFQRRALKYEKESEALLAKTEDKDAQFDGLALQRMMVKEYLKS